MDVSLVARKWPDSGCDASSQRQDSGYKMGVKLVASGYKISPNLIIRWAETTVSGQTLDVGLVACGVIGARLWM